VIEGFTLEIGDCLAVLKTMAENSVDSVVTDPPYGLSFMGKQWDYDVPGTDVWAECLRVLKPGGYLLAFAGTRTQHRMAVRIEDAGFEIRDMIAWVYGSGFPKSHNGEWGGTALKPALEPVTVARKPLEGTVEANWREHGTGALNIDGCRVAGEVPRTTQGQSSRAGEVYGADQRDRRVFEPHDAGRWPANLIHDGSDEVLAGFPQAPGQQGPISSTAPSAKTSNVYGAMRCEGEASANSENVGAVGFKMRPGARRLDEGSAARFFYCAKAAKKDRGDGNHHPTVKPTDLMRYLCRLVTPVGGLVLDPFMGSGSTGKAAVLEGFRFVGIEREPDYVEIANARIRGVEFAESLPTMHPTLVPKFHAFLRRVQEGLAA